MSGAATESPPRTEQQAAAIEERDRDVFMRAGAGTGKTSVLVARFCAAALDPDVGVERILAFTFTERAADQLRRRVRRALSQRAREASGDELGRLREAERATDRAWISTIHGFCRRLLASHPAAAGIDPRFRVVDEPEADRLADRAFDTALDQMVEAGSAEALEFAAANRRGSLLEMVRGAHDELRSQNRPPLLPAPPAADTSAPIGTLVEAAREALEECAEVSGPKALLSRERIAAALELDPAAAPRSELLDALGALKIVSTAGAFSGEACERYTKALARARGAVAAHVLGPAYEQLRSLVEGFGGRYERLKAERSALDFEDLQLRAVELLAGSETLRERYREQFRHLMVDEFQDTNELQLSLIRQLRGPDTRLFMVGDEFQSIYGFRHAEVEVYRRQHRRFARGTEPNGVALPLTGNFRAEPELVAATNAIGAGLLGEGFEPLTAASPPEGAGGTRVEMLLTVDDAKAWEEPETGLPRLPDDPSSGSKVAEARLLAARLAELVEAGEDPAEIVVLLRAFTHVNTIERALTEAGLDPYVVGGRGFWSQQQVEDMRCLLALVANPLDDQALLGALASPACAVLPDALWLLRRAATPPAGEGERERPRHIWPLLRDVAAGVEPSEGDPEAASLIPDDERERLVGFATRLEGLRQLGTEGGLETLVERVATAHGYDLATLSRADGGEARWSNVRKLMRLAREFEAREGPDLTAFLEYLETSAARRDREAEAATRAEGHAGVRVMTVHKAKGLEFGVVAVADLGRGLQLGWTPLRVAPGEDPAEGGEATRVGVQLGRLGRPAERLHDYDELTELSADREAEEEGRLAYVAATRAKRRLLLSGTLNPKRLGDEPISRKPIAVQLARTMLGGELEERELDIPAAGEGFPTGRMRLRMSAPGPGAGASLLRARPVEPSPTPAVETEPPLGRPSAPPALSGGLSYSALSELGRCGYRFYVERVLGIREPELADRGPHEDCEGEAPRRFGPGVAVHALLEWSARNRWRPPSEERTRAALAEQGLDPDGLLERASGLVAGFLGSPLAAELQGARVSPEAPFVLAVGDTLVRGSIDLLVARPDGSVLVLDYKTDRLDGRSPEEAAEAYTVQRDLYALAASARGAPIETAYLFLEQPETAVRTPFDDDRLALARSGVEELLAELRSGSFEVTRHPHKRLCLDCPARARLCSHQPAATLRDDPEPPLEPAGPGRRGAADPEADEPAQLTLLDG